MVARLLAPPAKTDKLSRTCSTWMEYMSASTQDFDAEKFITLQTEEIKRALGKERAIIAVSGGVDSTTCAALTRRAIGKNLECMFIDTGFMRRGEPERVKKNLAKAPLRLPLRIIRAQKRFMDNLQGLADAEDKRKAFREIFYSALAEAARKEGCKWLVQGTIAADLIETESGIKTQHNVLSQIGIDPKEEYGFKVVEPLATIYKPQVRILSRILGFPEETSERQPFPGPGLMVRCVAAVSKARLKSLKIATDIVEKGLKDLGAQQYFAAVIDNDPSGGSEAEDLKAVSDMLGQNETTKIKTLPNLATGISGGRRTYGKIAAIQVPPISKSQVEKMFVKSHSICKDVLAANPAYSRLLFEIKRLPRSRSYAAVIRAIKTVDFMTAEAPVIPWKVLDRVSSKILVECRNVSSVYYDLTPKPPATIEFE